MHLLCCRFIISVVGLTDLQYNTSSCISMVTNEHVTNLWLTKTSIKCQHHLQCDQ